MVHVLYGENELPKPDYTFAEGPLNQIYFP